jgi:glycosyltransferase involved in cell wall biosynthesis
MFAASDKPKITVIMAVHNGKRFLDKSIESILNQTFHNFEFIIIDDGSTDGSSAILELYAKQDSRVRLVTHERQGLTKSLNVGLRLSQGELIARMDADDISYPRRFEAQMSYLELHPNVVCLGAQAVIIDEDGDPIEPWNVPLRHDEILDKLLHGLGGQVIHPLFMVRRETLIKAEGYNEDYKLAQDYDILLRLSEFGLLANLHQVLLGYRIHASCATFSKRKEQLNYVIKAFLEAHDRRETPMSTLTIPGLCCPTSIVLSHVDLARKAVIAGNIETSRKHALQALPSLKPFSRTWLEMKKCSNAAATNMYLYNLLCIYAQLGRPLIALLRRTFALKIR